MNDVEINVQIRHINDEGPTMAYATVKLGGCFVIRDVRVVEGRNGLFISMPSRKAEDKYEDICFPCTKEFHQQFKDAVLEAYNAALEQQNRNE